MTTTEQLLDRLMTTQELLETIRSLEIDVEAMGIEAYLHFPIRYSILHF